MLRDGFAILGVRKGIVFPDFGQISDGYSLMVKVSGSRIHFRQVVSFTRIGF